MWNNTFFRRISSWLCWLGLSIRRLWAWSLHTSSGSRSVTRPRKTQALYLCFSFLVLCSLLFGIDPVYAGSLQDPSTPTPTWEPLYKTPTPQPTHVVDCPAGAPAGWGTVTPAASWRYQCSKCIPLPTVMGTRIPGVWGTNTPVPTITPTASATLIPITMIGKIDGNNMQHDIPWGISKAPIDWGSGTAVTWQFDGGAGVGIRKVGIEYIMDYYMVYESGGWQNDIYLDIFNAGASLLTVEFIDGWRAGQVQTINSGAHYNVMVWHEQATKKVEIRDRFNLSWSSDVTNYDVQVKYYAYSAHSNGATKIQGNTTWFDGGYRAPTETPAASWCNSVKSPDDAGELSPDDIMHMPGFELGSSNCAQIGGWDVNITWIANLAQNLGITWPDTIGVPGFNVCTRVLRFGVMRFMGLEFDFDLMATVMMGIAVLRMFFRS